jgi:hypothetical protein
MLRSIALATVLAVVPALAHASSAPMPTKTDMATLKKLARANVGPQLWGKTRGVEFQFNLHPTAVPPGFVGSGAPVLTVDVIGPRGPFGIRLSEVRSFQVVKDTSGGWKLNPIGAGSQLLNATGLPTAIR